MNTSLKALAGVTICIILASSILVLSIQNPYPLLYFEVPFEVVDPGGGYYYASRANFTITNTTFWESLWSFLYSGHSDPPDVPIVNFTSDMLIAVFQGERGSSGYMTNITKIMFTTTYYVVYVDEIHPGENCGTAAVMTYPYQIVKINNQPLNLPVRYIYNVSEYDCG